MATVYLAVQESLARTVAMKIMAPHMMANPSAEERFLKEGKIVARLKHPNIITVYDIGIVNEHYYMIMEYIEGGNLNERIDRGLSIENTINVIKQIASALAYAHKRGFIHRDIKPANILFRDDGTAVLSDFGIAKAPGSQTQLTRTGQIVGTPKYMSPEQITGKPLDSRSDLYSLGLLFFEMLTREKPFKGEDAISIAMGHMVAPIPRLPHEFTFFQPLIDKLLAKSPNERLASSEQLILTLEDLLERRTYSTDSKEIEVKAPSLSRLVHSTAKHTVLGSEKAGTRNLTWVSILMVLVICLGALVYYWQIAHRIDSQTKMVVDMLLNEAENHRANSRLIEPAGDNAYESFRSVLALNPGDKEALEGLRQMADQLEKQAFSKLRQNQFEQAFALIRQGLQIVPQHTGLLALERRINERQAQRLKQQKLARLISQAERQLTALQFIEPLEDNALASLRKALELDPENAQARVGLERITKHYEQIARRYQAEGDFEKGLTAVGLGLEVLPGYVDLQVLRSELKGQLETRAREQADKANRQREIQRLLALAKQQLAATQFIEPQDDNARETLQAVMNLDPFNQSAQAGLRTIAAHYENEAQRAKGEGRLEDALSATRASLKAVSAQPELLALKEQITRQLGERARHERLLSELLASAQEKQHAGDYEQSLSLIEEGLKINPRHTDFIAFRKEVLVQLDEHRQKRRLDELVFKAEQQFAAFKLTRPVGDNSYESYVQVLQISPLEERALAGLQRIAERYLAMGQAKLGQGAAKESLEMIERGLRVISDHPGLLALRDETLQALETQQSQRQEILDLLSKAQQQLRAKRLTQPPGDNALEHYQEVLKIDPKNPKARDGIELIAENYQARAQAKQRKGELQKGLIIVEEGLGILPTHPGLLSLQSNLTQQMKTVDIDDGMESEADVACADKSEEHVFSGGAMVGCAGSVTWGDRDSLCSAGWTACSADQWVDLRRGLAPTHSYWTSDELLYYGNSDNCLVSVSDGNACNLGTPMRVCAGASDPEGNQCNWFNCGYDDFTPNEYFGGCNGNNYAGTLCCRAE